MTIENQATPAVPLTKVEAKKAQIAKLREKITSLEADVAKLLADEAANAGQAERIAALTKGLPNGTTVIAVFGRDTATTQARTVKGTVKAFKSAEGKAPATYAVETGEGFDLRIVKIAAGAITEFYVPQAVDFNAPTEPFQPEA